jgi:hypothetical protein
MQAMPGVQDVASGRVLSAGATLVIGAGLALYQLTSLVMGPVANRQLDFSLTIPAVEGQDLSEPPAPAITVVVGTQATPAVHAVRVSTPRRAVFVATPPRASSQPRPTVIASPASHSAGKKHHTDD